MMCEILLDVIGDLVDWTMETSKSWRNCLREVWYISFTIVIFTIKKYNTEPLVATELGWKGGEKKVGR